MSDQMAVKPDKFFKTIPALVKEKEARISNEPSVEEKILAKGSKTAFWKTLRGILENVVDDLDQINNNAMEQGKNYEEIGRNTIVISLTKGIIKGITDKVDDAQEVYERPTEGD